MKFFLTYILIIQKKDFKIMLRKSFLKYLVDSRRYFFIHNKLELGILKIPKSIILNFNQGI